MIKKELTVEEKKDKLKKEIDNLSNLVCFQEGDIKKRRGELIETTLKGIPDTIFSVKVLFLCFIPLFLEEYNIIPTSNIYSYILAAEAFVFIFINIIRFEEHRYNEEEFRDMIIDGEIPFYFMIRKELKKNKQLIKDLNEQLDLIDFNEEKKADALTEDTNKKVFDDVVLNKSNILSEKCNVFSNNKKKTYLKEINTIVTQYRNECIEIAKSDKENKDELFSLSE